jgi:hypothetical protein
LYISTALAAGESVFSVAAALAAVAAFGYLAGSLLVECHDEDFGLAWAVIRTVAGLLLATAGFLASLVLSLPWYAGPAALVAAALAVRRTAAFSRPRVALRLDADGIAAAVLGGLIVSPILITAFSMARGSFPPVFFNIDTAYAMEKVHAFVATQTYPPESLSNAGIHRTYHYGTQAMAALIARTSGLLPHHAMFAIVLPLLAAGVLAAAALAARLISPNVPRSVAVPLLLVSVPTLANPFWERFGRQLWEAATTAGVSPSTLIGDYGLWGVLSNEGPNVGADFVILASLAGIAAAPVKGWALPSFLIGVAILVKTPTGVALAAGFALAEAWRMATAMELKLSRQALLAGGTFIATAVLFFLISFESNFQVETYPLFHVRQMIDRGNIPGMTFDLLWLLLPAAIALSAGIRDPDRRSTPLLLIGLAPLIVVNATRMDNTRPGGGGTGDDWFQMLHAVPFVLHAFVLSVGSCRWVQMGTRRRAAFLVVTALIAWPVAAAAAHYSMRIIRDPQSGNDFVDNRSLGEALSKIPTTGTMVVTNDLRYPAGNFTRDYRQMQIPALFGHQAFAVNYAHEAVEERRPLQELLQQPAWSDAILEAAAQNRWTHFLVRKDYAHPEPIPLTLVFENDVYAVYRFP